MNKDIINTGTPKKRKFNLVESSDTDEPLALEYRDQEQVSRADLLKRRKEKNRRERKKSNAERKALIKKKIDQYEGYNENRSCTGHR